MHWIPRRLTTSSDLQGAKKCRIVCVSSSMMHSSHVLYYIPYTLAFHPTYILDHTRRTCMAAEACRRLPFSYRVASANACVSSCGSCRSTCWLFLLCSWSGGQQTREREPTSLHAQLAYKKVGGAFAARAAAWITCKLFRVIIS